MNMIVRTTEGADNPKNRATQRGRYAFLITTELLFQVNWLWNHSSDAQRVLNILK